MIVLPKIVTKELPKGLPLMRKQLFTRSFNTIQELSEGENKEDHKNFWENSENFLKLGSIEDVENHKRITLLIEDLEVDDKDDVKERKTKHE